MVFVFGWVSGVATEPTKPNFQIKPKTRTKTKTKTIQILGRVSGEEAIINKTKQNNFVEDVKGVIDIW